MSRWIDANEMIKVLAFFLDNMGITLFGRSGKDLARSLVFQADKGKDVAEIVRCRECKHRPIKEDADGEDYGFNLIEPTEGDERCPCLVADGWYSWMPNDNFYCGFGEREGE